MNSGAQPRRSQAPDWLLRAEVGLCPCGCIGRRSRHGFVDKTLQGTARVLRQSLGAADVSASGGLLQRLDPRVKLVTILGVIIAAALVRHALPLAVLYAAALAVAAASALPLRQFLERVWLFVPAFTGLVVLPATLNVVTAGHVVISLGTWFGHPIGLTSQGIAAAVLIVLRVAVSVSLVALLTLTTPWNELLAALRAVRVPRIFVLIVSMAYRYVFVLLDTTDEMYLARKARTVKIDDRAGGRRFVAATAGTLLAKTHALAEEVHQAMVARGWQGEARTLSPAELGAADLAWVVSCAVAAAAALGFDRFLGG